MSGRLQMWDVSLLMLVAAMLLHCATAFGDLPGIRRDPYFFNDYYRRIVDKRFDEDRPYYRWSPKMFQRYAGTFKRSAPEEDLCVPPAEPCELGLRATSCCGLLQCLPDAHGFSCQSPAGQPDGDSFGSNSDSVEDTESDEPAVGSSGVNRVSWMGRAPVPFYPRNW